MRLVALEMGMEMGGSSVRSTDGHYGFLDRAVGTQPSNKQPLGSQP